MRDSQKFFHLAGANWQAALLRTKPVGLVQTPPSRGGGSAVLFRGHGLVGSKRLPVTQEIVGSNPTGPAIFDLHSVSA